MFKFTLNEVATLVLLHSLYSFNECTFRARIVQQILRNSFNR